WKQTVAPTGLCFYTGHVFPAWKGDLIVPGLSKGSLWRLRLAGNTVVSTEEILVNDRVRLRKAIVSPKGQLYLLTDEADGKLLLLKNSAAR
ncbi:MAG: PQQ-dependent sugar dehydrogenase, partial [Bacteroidota bacterium]